MFHPVHRSSALLRVLVVIFIALLPSLAHAQTLVDWSALPSCASNCEPFFKAQDGCLPSGGAPVSNQQTYVSCFCQSAMLTNFRAGSGIECTGACPSVNDQTAIQQWYVNFCKSGGGQNTQASSATSSSTTTTSSSTAPTYSAPDSTATRNSNSVINDYDGDGDPSNNYEGSWISAHWKWVLMLIIIFFAMIFFSIFGMWLKRRHRAKQDAKRSNLAGGEAGNHNHPNNPNNTGGAGAVPPPPPMAHLKNANDSGTLASTLDLPNNTSIAPTSPLRPRSRTNTLTRFPNGSMSNVGNGNGQQQPVVWGPHQHQAATRGYEYHGIHHQMSGSPGPSVPPSPVSVPTPSLTPVGGFSMNNNSSNSNNRFSGGSKDNVKSMSRDVVIDEVADEDRIEPAVGAEREGRLRRKLSRR